MTTSTSLIELLLNLLRNPEELAAYADDPEGYLAACGAENLDAHDVHDALTLISDDQDADFEREYNTGGNSIHIPAPHDPPAGHDHESAVTYINEYITTNHIDDRDTIVDNSVNQQIDTGGGDFDQDIDIDSTVASGDGAVAAGDDIEDSNIATGDRNVVGDGAQGVTGDDNTTAFGRGDASSTEIDDVTVDDGGAVAVGGNAAGSNSSSDDDTTTTTTTTTTVEDSGNSEFEQTTDSYNENNSENNLLSKNDVDVEIASDNVTELPAIV